MRIGGIQSFSLVDYPGKDSCVIFMAGCNYRCPYCNAAEFVLPEEIKKHQEVSLKRLFKFLRKQKRAEAVCISGGEPTIFENLPLLCRELKTMDYLVKIDTNGSNPEMLKKLIDAELVDYISVDIKAPKEKYPLAVGIDCSPYYMLAKIEESVDLARTRGVDYEFSTTLVPRLLKKKDILNIARWISPAKRWVLREFESEKTLVPNKKRNRNYSREDILILREKLLPFFEEIIVR